MRFSFHFRMSRVSLVELQEDETLLLSFYPAIYLTEDFSAPFRRLETDNGADKTLNLNENTNIPVVPNAPRGNFIVTSKRLLWKQHESHKHEESYKSSLDVLISDIALHAISSDIESFPFVPALYCQIYKQAIDGGIEDEENDSMIECYFIPDDSYSLPVKNENTENSVLQRSERREVEEDANEAKAKEKIEEGRENLKQNSLLLNEDINSNSDPVISMNLTSMFKALSEAALLNPEEGSGEEENMFFNNSNKLDGTQDAKDMVYVDDDGNMRHITLDDFHGIGTSCQTVDEISLTVFGTESGNDKDEKEKALKKKHKCGELRDESFSIQSTDIDFITTEEDLTNLSTEQRSILDRLDSMLVVSEDVQQYENQLIEEERRKRQRNLKYTEGHNEQFEDAETTNTERFDFQSTEIFLNDHHKNKIEEAKDPFNVSNDKVSYQQRLKNDR